MTLVTLIHGTWARKAPWSRGDSPLAIAIKNGVADTDVIIKTFDWSGWNEHIARRRAADRLRAHIQQCSREYSTGKHFLIAHSHGGNVALYAAAAPEVQRMVDGIICLSTPFIVCRRRAFPKNAGVYFGVVIFMCLFFGLGVLFRRVIPIEILRITVQTFTAMFGLLLLYFGAVRLLSRLVLHQPFGKWSEIYEAIGQSFALPLLPTQKVLILRAPGDEASAALGASSFGSWLFGRLSRSVEAVHRLGTRLQEFNQRLTWQKRTVGFLVGLTPPMVIYALAVIWTLPQWSILPFILVSAISILTAAGFLFRFFGSWGELVQISYVVVIMPLLVIASLFSGLFGIDAALVASLFEFSAETTPIGDWRVICLRASSARGLWHSVAYSDQEALDAMVNWINASGERAAR